jgi:hypothetical protein
MKKLLLPVLAGILCCYSCKKNDSIEKPTLKPMITEQGELIGSPVSKVINATGGSITSSDGRIKVDIPAGALVTEQRITIQPITNEMKTGIGNAYRLTPHNITFQKPVSISFTYNDDEIKNTIPDFLGIGYQKDDGGWHAVGGVQVDKVNKKITVTSTHFSDWGFFAVTLLQPVNARVNTNAELELSVLTVLDGTEIPLPGVNMNEPFLVLPDRIKSWHYSGEGSLQGNGPKAHYRAPSKVPAQNPEAVSVSVNLNRPGTYLMVSNITVLSEFHIDYLQVDETEQNAAGSDYTSRLHIYGNFGNDPGEGKRSVKIAPTPISSFNLNVVFWTPKLIVCDLQSSGPFQAK